ncbi:ubiquinone biosynthesis monooxygenase COQ6, mitochondrial [Leptopilina heterotoma]|uniref:ubiquinone biosynthesis monooxygenase COQ6, mitochondrial n=1 Tax=Leptopilina heterotoma TaxID=63436 RepID=UPI001CA926AA|nr:ubiquinone biosynthesis monooxygenase COQ6, mitochondrial [Leptopilina heterotoma]
MAVFSEAMSFSRCIFPFLSRNYKFTTPQSCTNVRNIHSTLNDSSENYDIIVTGGGLVGTTLACALANNKCLKSKSILLLEGGNKHEYTPSEQYSNRVVALNQLSRTLLSSIGAWKHVKEVRYAPVRKMQVWDSCSDAMITFNEDYLSEEIAYVVENDLLLYAVNKQLAEKESVRVIYNSKVENISLPETSGDSSVVILQNGGNFCTKLLIGADGINSRVRQAMGVQHVKWSYNQMGIVGTVELSEPTENIVAWQRFLPTGPIALLPLTKTLSSLVWSTSTEEAKKLLKLSDEAFVDNLNEALWKVYPKDGTVESGMKALQQILKNLQLETGVSRQLQPSISGIIEESRAAFPLGFAHSVYYVKPGVALVGDAAHRVHPLGGQGLNLGLGDVMVLVQMLADATKNGALPGDMTYLKKYETARQRHNVPTMLAMDALHRLYKGTAAPIVLARSLGLQLTNAIPPLKRAIFRHASDDDNLC